MHLESSKLLVDEFARLVLPFGTTTVVADPHEIANVLGTDGVHWLIDVCADIPLDVYFMASSCVPASSFESPRRELTPGDLDALLRRRRVIGLAEMMNFPGVIGGAPSELAKLALARARRRPRSGRARPVAERLRGRRDRLGPRGVHARGGARAPPRRDVAPDPRSHRSAKPARAPASARRIRSRTDRVLHRRSRAGAHCGRRPHQRDGAGRCRLRDPGGGCAGLRIAQPCAVARPRRPRGDRARLPRRPARAARPRALRAGAGTEERGAGRRMAARHGARLGSTHDAHRRVRPRDVPRAVGRRQTRT